MTNTKKNTIQGKICSKYQLQVNRKNKIISELKRCNANRKKQIQDYDKLTKFLMKENRLTKLEISKFLSKKKDLDAFVNNKENKK